jgi:hypothetical protein
MYYTSSARFGMEFGNSYMVNIVRRTLSVRKQNPAKPEHDEQNPLISHFKVCVVSEYGVVEYEFSFSVKHGGCMK